MQLLDDWLGYTGIRDGLLFRRVFAGPRIGDRLSPGAAASIVKRAGHAIGLSAKDVGQLSGHSTRVGAAPDLLALTIEIPAPMQAGPWKDTRMPLRYGEPVLASRAAMARAAKAQGRQQQRPRLECRRSGASLIGLVAIHVDCHHGAARIGRRVSRT